MFITVENLKKSYQAGENKNEVLGGISLTLEKGQIGVILGPSGSGKSTLMNIIGTFYAQGYRRNQLRRHYLTFPLLISVIGSVMGSVVGLLLVDSEIRFMLTAFPMPVQKTILNPWLVVFAAALPIVILCGVTWCIIGRTLKTAPAVLM